MSGGNDIGRIFSSFFGNSTIVCSPAETFFPIDERLRKLEKDLSTIVLLVTQIRSLCDAFLAQAGAESLSEENSVGSHAE